MGTSRQILFVQSTTEIGGAETVLLNLLGSSSELRQRSAVVTLGFGDGDLPTRLRELGVEVIELQAGRLRQPFRSWGALSRAVEFARQRGVKVVVGNGSHPQVFGSLIARAAGARSVHFVHMIHAERASANEAIDSVAINGYSDLILANSQASLSAMRQLRPRVESRLLYPGTPATRVPPNDAAAARREFGTAEGEVVFGCFGRLQRWKGQDVFVEAAARVQARHQSSRFVVVGGAVFGLEQEFLNGLRKRVQDLGLSERVLFTGYRSDVSRLMAGCDVVCHTSRRAEPFGMVIIEALAQGRPVIATRGGGPSEILADSSAGLLIDAEAPEQLAEAMLGLAHDATRRASMGAAARTLVEETFTSEVMSRNFLRHLEAIL